jgi:AraC-like DNA-binding protein
MIFHAHTPSYPVSNFIDCFFYFREFDPIQRIERFLPDGNVELVIDLTQKPKFIYDNNDFTEIQECNNTWLSGIRTKPISIPAGENSEMFIVYFKKGMAYHFTQIPLFEITDTVTNTDLLCGREILDLRNSLLATTSVPGKFNLAEQYFLKKYDRHSEVNPAIQYAIRNILSSPDALTIKRIQDNIGYSHKHFIQLFRLYTGITPKAFQRIMRFQKVITDVENRKAINWAQLATTCGYYDQSHFIEDFRHYSGFTPVEYMNLKGPDLNYVTVG